MEVLLLYATPFIACLGHSPVPSILDVMRTMAPLVVVIPTSFLPLCIRDLNWEHVARHAVYTVGFSVSVGTSVQWDVVWPAVRASQSWALALLAYCIMGVITLSWFTIAHILENYRILRLHTHHGDIAVLPLTFVAIASFVIATPDDAFVWSRSILFFVPIVVGWSTLNFVGHLGFATSSTTTHHLPGFYHVARAAIVVASAHLTLIELRVSPVCFQFMPLVAALVFMHMPPVDASDDRPLPWRWRLFVCLLAAAGGALLCCVFVACASTWNNAFNALRSLKTTVATVYACVVACAVLPPVTRSEATRRSAWAIPATGIATLLTAAYVNTSVDPQMSPSAVALMAAALGVGYATVFAIVAWVAPRLPNAG